MKTISITFRGPRKELDSLLAELASIDNLDSADIKSIKSSTGGLLSRDPLNQLELIDVVVALGIHIVGSYVYEQIRATISEYAKNRGFIELNLNDPTAGREITENKG